MKVTLSDFDLIAARHEEIVKHANPLIAGGVKAVGGVLGKGMKLMGPAFSAMDIIDQTGATVRKAMGKPSGGLMTAAQQF